MQTRLRSSDIHMQRYSPPGPRLYRLIRPISTSQGGLHIRGVHAHMQQCASIHTSMSAWQMMVLKFVRAWQFWEAV